MSNTNPWEEITVPSQNIKARLIDSNHPIEISWAVNQEGQYLLVLVFNNLENCSINDFPKVTGFDIILTELDVLVITLNNKEQWELFYSLCAFGFSGCKVKRKIKVSQGLFFGGLAFLGHFLQQYMA